MLNKENKRSLIAIVFLLVILPLLLVSVQTTKEYLSKAVEQKAQIYIDTARVIGPLPQTWRALAQGGEEKGVRMLANVIGQTSELAPRYIRIDHIYDFYNVVQRHPDGGLILNWSNLDQTVCDILRTGARPFFSLGYMPTAISKDGSIISEPANWEEWVVLVQKTIEHYSGQNEVVCGAILDKNLDNVYYEVWNEPDLESFGKWSLYGGNKDYKTLYYYSSKGAQSAQNVKRFFFGGPAITRAYHNWFKVFLDYVKAFNLRLDFLSWHHYSQDPEDFYKDMDNINLWLAEEKYAGFRNLPRIISEWGFDSGINPLSETEIAAAHTISSIRHLVDQNLEMAFAFEIKDGQTPRWGILSYAGEEKPRYKALKLLNKLGRTKLHLYGEGAWVKAIASRDFGKISTILVNYDLGNKNTELVPVTFTNLEPGNYAFTQIDLSGREIIYEEVVGSDGVLLKQIYMPANTVYALDLVKI